MAKQTQGKHTAIVYVPHTVVAEPVARHLWTSLKKNDSEKVPSSEVQHAKNEVQSNFHFFHSISITQITSFMKIRSTGAELFHADRQAQRS
jgi:hypothetical protein